LGIGDWGLGVGGLGPGPQTPTPKPQAQKNFINNKKFKKKKKN